MDHRPVLAPDALREVHDFAQADPPNPVTRPDFVRGPVGCSFSVGERVTCSGSLPTAWRNGALRLTGSVDGDSGFFSLLARLGQVGGARFAYALTVRPGLRSLSLARLGWGDGKSYVSNLRPWSFHPEIPGPGVSLDLELRFADSVMQVVVDDHALFTVEDAGFGFGRVGWRVGTYEGPDVVRLRRLALYDLA